MVRINGISVVVILRIIKSKTKNGEITDISIGLYLRILCALILKLVQIFVKGKH